MHIQDPVKHLYLELFCENSSQYGPKYVSGIPMVSFAKPKKMWRLHLYGPFGDKYLTKVKYVTEQN